MGLANVGEKALVFKGCVCDGCTGKIRKLLKQIHGIVSIDFNQDDRKFTIHGSNVDPNMVITELGKMKRTFELVTKDYPALDKIEEKIIGHQTKGISDEIEEEKIIEDYPSLDKIEEEKIIVHQTKVISDEIEEEKIIEDYPSLDKIEEEKFIVHQMKVLSDEVSSVVLCKKPAYNQVVDLAGLSITPRLHFRSDDHDHELELKNYDKRFTCNGCKEEGFRTRYRCKHCDYELHKDCMHPKPTISHELFAGSVFKFCHQKPTCSIFCRVHTKSCEACRNGIHGYSYHCEAKDLYLHPMCVNFRGKICIEGETYALRNKGKFKCIWCNSIEKTDSGWSYVSESTKCQLHVNCVAKIVHEAWKEQHIIGGNDAYIMVLEKRLNLGLVKNKKRCEWSKGGKLVKMILVFARTIIGILLGDPTAILASMLVEIIKK